jgi:hypothetical protein
MIDQASVFASKYKSNPQILQATVLGQGPDPSLDPYTALRALQLIKESNAMQMAQQAQGPTSAPSLASQAVAPQGLAAMVPMGAPAGQMPQQMGQAPQGMPPQQAPQAPVMQASGGLAGMYTPEEDYAAGGIVAFSGEDESLVRDPGKLLEEEMRGESFGTEKEYWPTPTDGQEDPTALDIAQARLAEYMEFEPKEMSAKEQEEFLDRYMARMKKAAGEDIYAPAKERLAAREAALAGDRKSDEGLALLTAAGAILKGRNLAEGASNALPAFAKQLGESRKAEQQEKRAIEQMNFALADAQRKERMGDARGAQTALEAARKFQQDANKAKADKLRYSADIAARTVQYSKPKGAGAGSGPKLAEQLYADNVANLMATSAPKPGESDEAFKARIRAEAGALTAQQTKTSFSTSEVGPNKFIATTAPVQQRVDADVTKGLSDFMFENKEYRKAVRDKNEVEAQRLLDAEELRLRRVAERSQAAVTPSGGGSARGPGAGKIPPPPGFNPD